MAAAEAEQGVGLVPPAFAAVGSTGGAGPARGPQIGFHIFR